jgi:hypothetical protein
VQITEDRKKRVIDLYFNQHKTYAEIAEIERMSIHDISINFRLEENIHVACKQEEDWVMARRLHYKNT